MEIFEHRDLFADVGTATKTDRPRDLCRDVGEDVAVEVLHLLFAVGRKSYQVGRCSRDEFAAAREAANEQPVEVASIGERTYWLFQGRYWWDNDGLNSSEVFALLVTRGHRARAQIERAQAVVSQGFVNSGSQRGAIADDVKQYVWVRDDARCRVCGSTGELQFDHVIPVALGGSSEPENLQILCGPCNRRKGAGLTIS